MKNKRLVSEFLQNTCSPPVMQARRWLEDKKINKDEKTVEKQSIKEFIESIKDDCEKFRSKNPEFFDMSFNKIILSDITPNPISA